MAMQTPLKSPIKEQLDIQNSNFSPDGEGSISKEHSSINQFKLAVENLSTYKRSTFLEEKFSSSPVHKYESQKSRNLDGNHNFSITL
jgi:hypothetical protein